MQKVNLIVFSTLICVLSVSCGTRKKLPGRISPAVRTSENEQRHSQYLYLEALRQKNLGKTDAALDLYNQAVAVDPDNAAALFDLSIISTQLKEPQRAYDQASQAVAVDHTNYWYNLMLANLAQSLGNADTSISIYNKMIALYPGKAELNYMLADAYVQKGEAAKAIESLDKLEESMGIMEAITMEKFKLYAALNDTVKAFAEVGKLMDAFPYEIRYKLLMGDLYLNADRDSLALEYYNKAQQFDPNDGYVFMSKANYYDKKGDSEAAKSQVRAALVNENIDVETKTKILEGYLSTLLQRKSEVEQMYELFDNILDQHPQEPQLHRLYAEFLVLQKKNDKAKEQLEITVDLQPTEIQPWLQLMGLAMNDKDYVRMTQVGHRALEYLPKEAQLYLYLGVAYSQEKNYDKAIEIFKKGISEIPEENKFILSDLYGQMGDVYHLSGKEEESFGAFEQSLRYNPQNVGVLNNYSYFLSLKKRDLGKAERMSAQTVSIEPDNSTFLDTYAWIFFQQGNYTLAKFYLENAIGKGGDKSADILEHYGDALFMTGETEEALKYWEKALETGSTSEVLKKKIKHKQYFEE